MRGGHAGAQGGFSVLAVCVGGVGWPRLFWLFVVRDRRSDPAIHATTLFCFFCIKNKTIHNTHTNTHKHTNTQVTKIAGLEGMVKLKELTLRSSLIAKMEGLGTLTGPSFSLSFLGEGGNGMVGPCVRACVRVCVCASVFFSAQKKKRAGAD